MNYQKAYDALIAYRKSNIPTGYTEKHHILPKSLGGSNDKENIVKLTAKEHFIAHRLLAKIHGGKMWNALFLMCNPRSQSAKGVIVTSRAYQTAKEYHAKYKSEIFSGEGNPFFGKTHDLEAVEKIRSVKRPSGKDHHYFGVKREDTGYVISFVKTYKKEKQNRDMIEVIHRSIGLFEYYDKSSERWYRMKSPELRRLKQYFVCKERDSKPQYGENNANYGNGQAIAGEKNPMFGKKHKIDSLIKMQERAKNRRKVKCPHCDKIGTVGNMNRWHFDNCKVVSERI